MRSIITLTALLLFTSACSHLVIDRSTAQASGGPLVTVKTHSFLFGLIPGSRISESDICAKSQFETLELKMNSLDVLLAIATLGIYIPERILAVCQGEVTAAR